MTSAPGAEIDVAGAARTLRERIGPAPPDAVLVLGSGLGPLVAAIAAPVEVPFTEVRGFPSSGVVGHQGRWVAGELEGRRVLVQAGRYHLYEGWPPELVCAPIRIAAELGARSAVLTNAAGGIRAACGPGTIVLLEDHLNLTGRSAPVPAGGPVAEAGLAPPRSPYSAGLRELAERCARDLGVPVEKGVYAGLVGPSYETPAEIRMLEAMGADVVGMSTVLEASAAAALGVACLGISLVTNHAAGRSPAPLSHQDVLEVGARSAATLERLLRAVVRELP